MEWHIQLNIGTWGSVKVDWGHWLGPLGNIDPWLHLHSKVTLILVVWEENIKNWLTVSVRELREGLHHHQTYYNWLLNILYASVRHMFMESASKLLGWRHKFHGRKTIWPHTAFPKEYSGCHHKNQRCKHAKHLKTNLLAILSRIYYFTSILTSFLKIT